MLDDPALAAAVGAGDEEEEGFWDKVRNWLKWDDKKAIGSSPIVANDENNLTPEKLAIPFYMDGLAVTDDALLPSLKSTLILSDKVLEKFDKFQEKVRKKDNQIRENLEKNYPKTYKGIQIAEGISNWIMKPDPVSQVVLEKLGEGFEWVENNVSEKVANYLLPKIGINEGDEGSRTGKGMTNFAVTSAIGGVAGKTLKVAGKAYKVSKAEANFLKAATKIEVVGTTKTAITVGTNLSETGLISSTATKPYNPTPLQKIIEDNTGVTRGEQSFSTLTKKELDLLSHENIIIDNPHGTVSIKLQSGKELIPPYKEINTNLHPQNINQLKHYSNEMIRSLTREEIITNVTNLELKALIEELYRPGAKIGSGSSVAAHLQETFTGKKVGNKFHAQKIENYSTKLERWLGNNSEEALIKRWDRVKTIDSADNLKEFLINSNVSSADRQIAKYLLDDMLNSLNDAKKLKIMRDSLK